MRKIILNLSAALLAVSGIGINADAQVRVSQRDKSAILQAKAERNTTTPKNKRAKAVSIVNNKIGVILAVDNNTTEDALEAQGLQITGRIGNYIYGNVDIEKVDALAATDGVRAFDISRRRAFRNDKARTSGYVDKVQAGTNLNQAYNGDGVIVGVVDGGFDPNHITFNGKEGKTRVKRLWEYNTSYSGKTSIKEYTSEKISSYTTDDEEESHGTHVLGTIAGSCTSTYKGKDYHGVAPNADITICGGDLTDNNILDGAKQIIEYAKSQGKPVTINMSLGDNYGPHDGTDSFTAALNELAAEAPIFVAAGNEGTDALSIIYDVKSDDDVLKTIITKTDYTYSYYSDYGASRTSQGVGNIDIWSDDDTPFKVYLDIVTSTDPSTPVYTLELTEDDQYVGKGTAYQYFITQQPTTGTAFDTYYSSGFMGGYVELNQANNRYHAELGVFLNPKLTSKGLVAIRIEGEAGHKVFVYADNYGVNLGSNDYTGYTQGNAEGSISNMACGKNTISVGAYTSRSTSMSGTVGEMCSYSSYGRLNDGRLLPDIAAPGSMIYSAMNSYLSSDAQYYYTQADKTISDGVSYPWTYMEGTSMATPYATGVGALMLQANPDLTVDQVRTILKETATAMTTEQAGSGKINALEAVKRAEQLSSGVNSIVANKNGVAIESLGNNQWNIYSSGENAVNVKVHTISGAVAKSMKANNDVVIDLNDLTPGIYVLEVNGAKSNKCSKVVVK